MAVKRNRKEYFKEYQAKNKEHYSERAKKYDQERRKDPEYVAKKKKYLNAWYKKNTKRQSAYQWAQRVLFPDKIRAIKARVRARHRAKMDSLGLSHGGGNPILTPEEMYVFQLFHGYEASERVPKKLRSLYAQKGAAVARANYKKKIEEAKQKFGIELKILKKRIHG